MPAIAAASLREQLDMQLERNARLAKDLGES
jgi:hypothetical protein